MQQLREGRKSGLHDTQHQRRALHQLVLADIREKAQYAEYDRERLLAQIVRMKDKEQHSRQVSYEQELKAAAARVRELEKLMENLYTDKCAGIVPYRWVFPG